MAMLKHVIPIGRTRGALSYRWLSSGTSKSLNLVDTLEMVKDLEAKNIPSTQAEALTRAITGSLESVMEKVKADIVKSEEYQSIRIVEEFQKLQANIDKMQAELRCDHDIRIHKIEQDFKQLKFEFEATNYEVLKYAVYTLASVAAAGLGIICLTL